MGGTNVGGEKWTLKAGNNLEILPLGYRWKTCHISEYSVQVMQLWKLEASGISGVWYFFPRVPACERTLAAVDQFRKLEFQVRLARPIWSSWLISFDRLAVSYLINFHTVHMYVDLHQGLQRSLQRELLSSFRFQQWYTRLMPA